jgi:hypothetical protein
LSDAAARACDQRDLTRESGHDTGFPPLTSTTEPHM